MNKLSTHRPALWSALCVLTATTGIVWALDTVHPRDAGLSEQRLERLSSTLQKYVDDEQLAGSVTLVARDGNIVYERAFGFRDRESGDPMRTDSMFRIASQTKAIVSVAAMTLVEQGRLLLSDAVGDYLPEFRSTSVAVRGASGDYTVVPARRQITVRDLLTHTSGFSYGEGTAADAWAAAGLQGWYFADRNEKIRDSVARMAALPADAQPGERWIYGYNTDILGALIEVVAGRPLDEYLNTTILGPLGMTDTHFFVPTDKAARLAVVYSHLDDELERAPADGNVGQGAYLEGPRVSFSGGAGLISTARDYARFLQLLLNGGELDGTRILGRKTVELMTINHIGDLPFRSGQGFGLGFSVVTDAGARGSHGSNGEFGWGGAYHSTYWVDPEEQLIVVHLTQLIPATGVDDQDKVRSLVYQSIVDTRP